jgi:hypothetical protein
MCYNGYLSCAASSASASRGTRDGRTTTAPAPARESAVAAVSPRACVGPATAAALAAEKTGSSTGPGTPVTSAYCATVGRCAGRVRITGPSTLALHLSRPGGNCSASASTASSVKRTPPGTNPGTNRTSPASTPSAAVFGNPAGTRSALSTLSSKSEGLGTCARSATGHWSGAGPCGPVTGCAAATAADTGCPRGAAGRCPFSASTAPS